MKPSLPLWAKVAYTLGVLCLVALQIVWKIELSWPTLALIVLALLPWASPWLESVRVGDFEAKFRELRSEVAVTRAQVEETRKEIDELKAAYQAMDQDYLAACADFDPDASATELNRLATRLKGLARGLRSIDFLFQEIASEDDQARVFGAACALQVRPQFEAIGGVVRLLDKLAADPSLLNFRLKTMYRLLMAVDEIVKLDDRNKNSLLATEQRAELKRVLTTVARHPRCAPDDTGVYSQRLVAKLG